MVTGGAGFIGSHLCEQYAKEGNEVIALDNLARIQILNPSAEMQKLFCINQKYLRKCQRVNFIEGDVRDFDNLLKLMRDVEIVFHTAGQVAVTASITDPITDFQINAYGTFNVCEAARRTESNPIVIFCSTNKVYGNIQAPLKEFEKRYAYRDIEGIDERYMLGANCPYGASKISAEMILQSFYETYGLPTIRARLSCIYGPRQLGCEDQAWVTHFTIRTLMGKDITVYGDGKQVRDILYISDLVRAFSCLARSREKTVGQAYNIGGGCQNSISLSEMIDLLYDLIGLKSKIKFSDWRLGDQKVYISDISKIRETTGWEPEVSIKKGMRCLVSWYKSILPKIENIH